MAVGTKVVTDVIKARETQTEVIDDVPLAEFVCADQMRGESAQLLVGKGTPLP